MFGSNDDKKTPAAAGEKAPAESGEKKSLFGWLRKKPQETAAEAATKPQPVTAEPVAIEPASPAGPALTADSPPAAEPSLAPEPLASPPALSPAEPPAAAAVVPDSRVQTPAQAAVETAEEAAKPGFFARFKAPESKAPTSPATEPVTLATVETAPLVAPAVPPTPAPVGVTSATVSSEETKAGFFARLKQGLSKTSANLGEGMASLFLGKKAIDDDLLDEIETHLLTADVGVEATNAIIQSLTQKVARKQLTDSGALYKALQEELAAMLKPVEQPLQINPQKKPFVILVVGVNGAGKTTTIGKLAKKLQLEGKKVMLAAGDTFRAAAVEQLQVWGERNQIAVIAQHTGADSASVIFDAVQAATARGMDVLIADTAGRLHTKDNLMEELKKVRRVIGKLDEAAPHEVLLVLDAGTGQNAINQAKQFNQTVSLTGLALTKLDGTAKGGVIFALAKQFGLPIRYIGVGESIDDLRTFEAEAFVQALFAEREHA
ncbi:signal recognition particle-docking protein FtsY [Pseudomonas cavernicola]|uniref:Signal recognition particle receptor FtsY n=1 Tax=Pseudomonas cavernicola TaxID=2320866 RepID=A0A418XJ55_9PSED|nr:signal recognition particle-docking protein FtsY [Pseudomonas cavernicola]RJG12494.1 signal recognition particle-docking protein FtsY [Pseudomonas cavernicola]